MASKTFIILFVILSMSSAIAQNGDDSNLMPCVQKILPCEPYLKSTSPPATCCIPLKEVVANDQKCLCAVFNNPELLRNFNVTQDEALKLAAACQANADVSICKPLLAEPPSDSPTTSPPAKGPNKPKGSAAHGITAFGGSTAIGFYVASAILLALF
ncbi:hypothetical protein CRG98_002900 [Punica granatum]|uniref:Bifunctional inhibitor/plant lipid transfer protein/seed storage helical domain-containing protein n=1 Tax=Punica granatum TaxID=22663 RepID=A0A2I0L7Q8_PUNGR|nr:hypothetical protein CRG98_002900 [Punica granatum]